MLTRGEMGILWICAMAAIGLVVGLLARGDRRRQELARSRHELLRAALQHPTLDEPMREELLRAISKEPVHGPSRARFLMVGWFGISWMLFVVGLGCTALDLLDVVRVLDEFSIGMPLVGFAMLSLPLALREWQMRLLQPFAARR